MNMNIPLINGKTPVSNSSLFGIKLDTKERINPIGRRIIKVSIR